MITEKDIAMMGIDITEDPVKCHICKKWFCKSGLHCMVQHPENQCCHWGDLEMTWKPK